MGHCLFFCPRCGCALTTRQVDRPWWAPGDGMYCDTLGCWYVDARDEPCVVLPGDETGGRVVRWVEDRPRHTLLRLVFP